MSGRSRRRGHRRHKFALDATIRTTLEGGDAGVDGLYELPAFERGLRVELINERSVVFPQPLAQALSRARKRPQQAETRKPKR